MSQTIGANAIYIPWEEMQALGVNHMEACLGRRGSYEDRLDRMLQALDAAKDAPAPYSIHLPLYLPSDMAYDYLDAFFLDENPIKRQFSIDLVETNLKKLKEAGYQPQYVVQHFAGINLDQHVAYAGFDGVLKSSLEALNELGQAYGTPILLEYIASNVLFHDPDQWVEALADYSHLGLLTDTGHLYFASELYGFDFATALESLAPASEAFHVWTVKGPGAYQNNQSYVDFHHLAPRLNQVEEEGWAFDTQGVLAYLASFQKPIIIEASMVYGGRDNYTESLKECAAMLRKIV